MTNSFYCRRHNKQHPTLEKEYAGDDVLLDFYKRKLPIKGWAGKMTCVEKEYAMRAAPWRRAAAERARERFGAKHQSTKAVRATVSSKSQPGCSRRHTSLD